MNNSKNTKNFHSSTCLYLVIICFSVYYEPGIIYAGQKIEHNYISIYIHEDVAVSQGGHRPLCTRTIAAGCSTSRSPIRCMFFCLGYSELVST
jgi:hypothetical protein